MPLKIFEKVSPFLKFRRPSSPVCEEACAAVADTDQVRVGAAHRPAGTYRQGRVELTLDFTDVEGDTESRGSEG